MARLPRSFTVKAGYEIHKTWRGHNREPNLSSHADKAFYVNALNEQMEKKPCGCKLESLVLMTNHPHEVFWIGDQKQFSRFMQRHHSSYGRYFNKRHGRSGQVAEGRAKTSLIQDPNYSMNATFYVHANPLRAGLVKDAAAYPWSTQALYAFGHRQPWMKNVHFPKWYLALGKNNRERQQKYRKLFMGYLKEEGVETISFFLAGNYFWGETSWIEQQRECLRTWLRERTCVNSMTAPSGPSLNQSD